MSKATDDVLAERQRQQSAEGWTPEHDDAYRNDELLKAAVCYAWPRWPFFSDDTFDAHAAGYWHPRLWPWAQKWWKPCGKRRNLVKAAALLLAEIERIDRADATPDGKSCAHEPDEHGTCIHCGARQEESCDPVQIP